MRYSHCNYELEEEWNIPRHTPYRVCIDKITLITLTFPIKSRRSPLLLPNRPMEPWEATLFPPPKKPHLISYYYLNTLLFLLLNVWTPPRTLNRDDFSSCPPSPPPPSPLFLFDSGRRCFVSIVLLFFFYYYSYSQSPVCGLRFHPIFIFSFSPSFHNFLPSFFIYLFSPSLIVVP